MEVDVLDLGSDAGEPSWNMKEGIMRWMGVDV